MQRECNIISTKFYQPDPIQRKVASLRFSGSIGMGSAKNALKGSETLILHDLLRTES